MREDIALAEAYAKAQGLWSEAPADAVFSDTLEIDLSAPSTPSVSGPRLPQERHDLSYAATSFLEGLSQRSNHPLPDAPRTSRRSAKKVTW